ncbi:MAG TPA: protein phosphatase 2C domain-containing protein, partial [bacterium]|nr:protein phosphatase 2C domain-containing protein [bacterium]
LGILKVEKHGSPPVLAENAVLALNDEAAALHRNNRVYIPTSNEGGLTFYPSKNMKSKERVVGDIVKVDTEKTTRQGDTVYVWMRTPDPSAKDGTQLHSTEPVPMSLAEARKLGIYVSHDGSLKIVSNEFVMTPVSKTGNQVLVGGKPFAGETDEGISVMFRLGKDGKIEMDAVEKPKAPKVELLPPPPKADLSGKKIPEVVKVLGPLGVGLFAMMPGTAEAATQISDTAATGGWMAAAGLGLTMLLGMAWWGGGGKGPEGPNHPPMVPADGVTRFEFRVGVDGKPTIVTGINQQTAMTFQRGPGGQWYAHEGDPPANTGQGVQSNWKPIKDGDLVKVFNPNTGEAYIIPFQAPKDAWIPGYAPSVMTDGPAQPAASGSLPVGKLTAINPYIDDRPFTIGRNAGDLKYGDLGVSDPHITIQRNLATGKYVLVNGKTGDSKVNEVLIGGVKMGKWAELNDGDVFAVRGADGQLAYFQFTDPKIPAGRVNPSGFVVLQGQSYSVRKYNQEVMHGQGALYGSVTYGSAIPGDPAGSITLAVYAGPNFDPNSGKHGTIAITVTAKQAKELGIVLGKDGRPVKPVEIKLVPGIEQQQMDLAAKANTATPLDVPPPPPPPAPKLKVVPSPDFVEAKFGNESFKIKPHAKSAVMTSDAQYGQFTRVTPHAMPGVYVAEITYGPTGDYSSKKMVINLTPTEMKSLGVKFNDQGQPVGTEFYLKILPGEDQASPAPKAPVDLSKVQMLLDDHVPGKPRSGEVSVGPTLDYGTASGETHVGIGSKKLGPDPVNEDALIQGKDYAVVLDGMGGQGHGDKASSIPGEAIARYLEEHKNDPDQAKVMADAFQHGYEVLWNSPLYDQIRADAKKNNTPEDKIKWPGTVGVAHKVVPDGKGGFNAIIVHVGDAGGVVVDKNGKVKYRTEDQGYAQYLVGQEAKSEGKDPTSPDFEKKKRFHPQGNIVIGGIVGTSAPKPVVQVVHLEPGDRIIMFSDGVGDNMSTTDIVDKALKAKNPKEAKTAIMQSTLQKL